MTSTPNSYRVVRNLEEQYSIWPADAVPPSGWTAVGEAGSREECLAQIENIWTDMRPRSLRQAMTDEESNENR